MKELKKNEGVLNDATEISKTNKCQCQPNTKCQKLTETWDF